LLCVTARHRRDGDHRGDAEGPDRVRHFQAE
jgi:hypothetical protein